MKNKHTFTLSKYLLLLVFIMLSLHCSRDREGHRERRRSSEKKHLPIGPCQIAIEGQGRAVSVKRLLNQISKNPEGAEYPPMVANFGGLTNPKGFIFDDGAEDIIIYGEATPKAPAAYFEDFVISLLNIGETFAEKKNDTIIYTYPGCSIDPDGKTMQRLKALSGKFGGSTGDNTLNSEWEKICRSPQKVSVFGVPFESRFGRVMVEADYDMKKIVDGSDPLSIEGFTSLSGMRVAAIREKIKKGQKSLEQQGSMSRFWFYPGIINMMKNRGDVYVCDCQVTLKTEEEKLTRSGKIKGKGKAEPMAKRFADLFTEKYKDIAAQRPIYEELNTLYKLFSLAQALGSPSTPQYAMPLLASIQQQHSMFIKTDLKKQLPGRSNIQQFQHTEPTEGGGLTTSFWLPSCGGVSMEIPAGKINYSKPQNADLASLAEAIKNSKPTDPEKFYWNFRRKKKRENNRPNETPDRPTANNYLVFSMDINKGRWDISDGKNTSGEIDIENRKTAYDFFNERISGKTKTIYIEMTGDKLSDQNMQAILEELRLHLGTNNRLVRIEFVPPSTQMREMLSEGEVISTNVKSRRPTQERRGRFAKWWKSTVDVLVKWKGKIRKLKFTIFSKNKNTVDKFHKYWKSKKGGDHKGKSIQDLIEESIEQLGKDLDLDRDETIFQLNDESDHIIIGQNGDLSKKHLHLS